MKRLIYLFTLIFAVGVITFTACEKEGVIVEEDTQGFDASADIDLKANEDPDAIYNLAEGETAYHPNKNKRSMDAHVVFDWDPGAHPTSWKVWNKNSNDQWVEVYSGSDNVCVLTMPGNLDEGSCTYLTDSYYFRITGTARGSKALDVRYYKEGLVKIDEDYYCYCTSNVNYYRTFTENYTGNPTEIGVTQHSCGEYGGCTCVEEQQPPGDPNSN